MSLPVPVALELNGSSVPTKRQSAHPLGAAQRLVTCSVLVSVSHVIPRSFEIMSAKVEAAMRRPSRS